MGDDRSVWSELCDLLEAADLTPSFDIERDCTKPCVVCGECPEPGSGHELVRLGSYLKGRVPGVYVGEDKDPMRRPVCWGCVSDLPPAIKDELAPAWPSWDAYAAAVEKWRAECRHITSQAAAMREAAVPGVLVRYTLPVMPPRKAIIYQNVAPPKEDPDV